MPGDDESSGLDGHEEVLEVVLLHEFHQRRLEPLVRHRDARLVDLVRVGVSARELADEGGGLAPVEANEPATRMMSPYSGS